MPEFSTACSSMPASQYLVPNDQTPGVWPEFLIGQTDKPVRVILIDDDANMSRVIANELLADLRIDLVGQGSSVREGRRLISQYEFDVMLVDLNLGDGTGFSLIEQLKTVRPLAEAVVISAMQDEQHALHAFELGATGYLVKNSWFGNFPQAVLQVVNGGASITPGMARRLLKKFDTATTAATAATAPESEIKQSKAMETLSAREKEVLKLVGEGRTSNAIGEQLRISGQTVNTHIKNMCRKLNLRTRAQVVNFATIQGLL